MKKNFIIVFILVATELIGFGLIIPVLPQISQNFTSSGFLIGLLLSSYSLAQFFAAPILGQLSDKFGRKPVLIFSKLGTICSYILLALSSNYTLLLISRLIDGFTGGNIAVARAYLADITAEENRSKAMAIIGVAFGTGFILGPALGGICYSVSSDFKIAGLVGATFSLCSLLITFFMLEESSNKKLTQNHDLKSSLFNISFQPFFLLTLSLLGMVIFSGFESSFALFTESKFGYSSKENSILFLIIGILAFFIQGSLTRFSIKSIQKAMMIAFTCISTSLILSSLFSSIFASLAPLSLLIFGIAILNTHIPAQLTTIEKNKGFIMGVYEGINSIARIIGPLLILSTLYSKINDIYLILGITTLIFLLITQLIFIRNKQWSL